MTDYMPLPPKTFFATAEKHGAVEMLQRDAEALRLRLRPGDLKFAPPPLHAWAIVADFEQDRFGALGIKGNQIVWAGWVH